MKPTPIISVIIPCYNYGKYLRQCLQSIGVSSISADEVEVLVIDDASKDDTAEITRIFKEENPQLTVLYLRNDTNLGLVRSRNRGIFYATGTFVFFLDADNYIGPDCLKIHTETLVDNPKAIGCYGPIQDFDNETNEFLSLRSNIQFSYKQLLHGPYIDAMALFRRKELIDFGMFDTAMPALGWEDYELWLRLGRSSKEICFIDTSPLSYYRKHGDNMRLKVKGDIYNQIIIYLQTKYPIQLTFEETEIVKRIRMPQTTFAQLFFDNSVEGMSESQSCITTFLNHSPLEFHISKGTNIQKLRFDPLNEYVHVQLKDIQFFENGKERKLKYTLSSNAFQEEEDGMYLFDTMDPQIYFYFKDDDLAGVDTVRIWVEYLSVGEEAQKIALDLYKTKWESVKTKLETSLLEEETPIVLMKQMHEQNASLTAVNELLNIETENLRRHSEALSEEIYYYKNRWKIRFRKMVILVRKPIETLMKFIFKKN